MKKSEKSTCQAFQKLLALGLGGTDKYFPAGGKAGFIRTWTLTTNNVKFHKKAKNVSDKKGR
ncbi:MAG: hypothetical protein IKY98_05355 [Alphaproteobacteria bacterium]|nr:hypothetical protein [Alphaproteobacteria bacterium]